MHATTEQLLSLRDGEPLAATVHDHVEQCDVCSRELARLARVRAELRNLPPVTPQHSLWQSVAVGSLERPQHRHAPWLSAIAVAASFVLGLFLIGRLDLGPIVTARYGLEETVEAIKKSIERADGKIMVLPN